MRRHLYTIKCSDVNKSAYSKNIDKGLRTFLLEFGGEVLPCDIGKEIWLIGGVICIENNEQRDKRLDYIKSKA